MWPPVYVLSDFKTVWRTAYTVPKVGIFSFQFWVAIKLTLMILMMNRILSKKIFKLVLVCLFVLQLIDSLKY